MDQIAIPGVPDQRVDLDQWFTEPALVKQMVARAGINFSRPITVLEPSAGQGAIVAELLRYDHVLVVAVEIDPAHVEHMRQRFAAAISTGQLTMVHADFLTLPIPRGKYDLAIMNPPFTFGAEFVSRALKCSNRVISLMRTSFLNGVKNYQMVWSGHSLARVAHLITRPKFGGAFTPAGDYSVFDIVPKAPSAVQMTETEWWR